MVAISARKRIWGWMMFDWASQPYSTLLLTFTFGPYFAQIVTSRLMADGTAAEIANAQAQAYWGYGLTATGVFIAIMAPILGAVADSSGRKMPWIWLFSILYVIGSTMLWFSHPETFDIVTVLFFFGVGLIGMEFATIFINSLLPTLGTKQELGVISGTGWALGYSGGVVALVVMLLLLAEDAKTGLTFLGIEPILGLDPDQREGTRSVGPLTAIWYAIFVIPFFLWVREPKNQTVRGLPLAQGLSDLWRTLKSLPSRVSMSAYLGSSMLYRDGLNGMYTFGGIYALGVLGWSLIDIGIFGIMAAITGAIFALIGGRADRAFGPKPVITTCIFILMCVAFVIVTISRTSLMGVALPEGSALPDIAFYICGGLIGAAGGALQSASRTMMVRQANPERMTEAFGLYALAGKATTFLAPLLIAVVSDMTDSQRLGITPLIGLFLVGLILLVWVKPDGD